MKGIDRAGRGTKLFPLMLIIMLIIGGIAPFFTSTGISEGNEETYPQITTDKYIYYIGENIQVSYTGMDSPGGPKFYKIYITNHSDPSSGFVFQQAMMVEPAIWDPQFGIATIIWNQTYQVFSEIGGQVAPGKYYAWYGWIFEKFGPAEFEIIEPIINAAIDIDPNTLNLKSKGRWITCYITLNSPYDVNDIDISTVILEDTIPAAWGDIQGDTLMVKFDRSDVQDMLSPGTYNLKVTGELTDGTIFQGYSDEIRGINPPKK